MSDEPQETPMENSRNKRRPVGQDTSSKLAVPAFLEVNMDSVVNLAEIPAGEEPFVVTYDEKYQVWVKVPHFEDRFFQ